MNVQDFKAGGYVRSKLNYACYSIEEVRSDPQQFYLVNISNSDLKFCIITGVDQMDNLLFPISAEDVVVEVFPGISGSIRESFAVKDSEYIDILQEGIVVATILVDLIHPTEYRQKIRTLLKDVTKQLELSFGDSSSLMIEI